MVEIGTFVKINVAGIYSHTVINRMEYLFLLLIIVEFALSAKKYFGKRIIRISRNRFCNQYSGIFLNEMQAQGAIGPAVPIHGEDYPVFACKYWTG